MLKPQKFFKIFPTLVIIIFCLFWLGSNLVLSPALAEEPQTTVSLPNPLGTSDLRIVVGNIIKGFMGLVGSIALLMFIYGGVLWLTSAGNSEKITKGREIILWAVLGLVVMFSSYVIVNFAISHLVEARNVKP